MPKKKYKSGDTPPKATERKKHKTTNRAILKEVRLFGGKHKW